MRFQIITGEKSKSCLVVAIGALLYLVECAFEEGVATLALGLSLFFSIHAIVLLTKCVLVSRKVATDANTAKLLKFVVVATLVTGLVAVCCIYLSGRVFDTAWPAYVNALVIGGLSAIFHLVPFHKFKRKPDAHGVPPLR